MKDYAESLRLSEKYILNADHLAYVTINIVKEKKLLLNILENIYKSLLYAINAILLFENSMGRIRLYKESAKNFGTFKLITENYNISKEDVRLIEEIILLTKKHKESKLEFIRGEKVVIMDNDRIVYFDLPKIKNYIETTKELLQKIKSKFHEIQED